MSQQQGMFCKDPHVPLLIQRGKQQVIDQVLDRALGCRAVRAISTRDIPRAGMQLEVSRGKLRVGMAPSGLPLKLAAGKGAFDAYPLIGGLKRNRELLIRTDDVQSLEVIGTAQGETGEWEHAIPTRRSTPQGSDCRGTGRRASPRRITPSSADRTAAAPARCDHGKA